MKRLKEKILEDNQIQHLLHLTLQLTLRLLCLPLQVTLHLLHLPLQVTLLRLLCFPIPQDQMILKSMTLVCLQSLPLVFVYFLHITFPKLKNKPMIARRLNMSKKNINHQNDVICFRKIYIINE